VRHWHVWLIVALILGGIIGIYALVQNAPKPPRPFEGAQVRILPYDGCLVRGISPSGNFLSLTCAGLSKPAIWSESTGLVHLPELEDATLVTEFEVADNGKAWGVYRTPSTEGSRSIWFTWSNGKLSTVRLTELRIAVHVANSDATEFLCTLSDKGVRKLCRFEEPGIAFPLDVVPADLTDFRPRFATDNLKMIIGTDRNTEGVNLFRLFQGKADLLWSVEGERAVLNPTAMSRNGRFLAAICEKETFLWSDGKRETLDFSSLPPSTSTLSFSLSPPDGIIVAISDDGELMIGFSHSIQRPIFIPKDGQPQLLHQSLKDEGIVFRSEGFELSTAEYLSRDGRVIAGEATNGKGMRPYVLKRR
jgi:hypothetical protein